MPDYPIQEQEMDDQLKEKVKNAPTAPGCYIFTDKYGYTVYVGKAKNLRNRVKSYFTKAAAEDERTAELVPRIVDVEFRVTGSELDALMLEFYLIKQHKPWFNSAMKADKQRPYLRISTESRYPALSVATEKLDDGAAYYDCFTDEEDVKATLGLLGRVWKVPQCGAAVFNKAYSPCLYHSISGCYAPCTGKADPEACHAAVREIQRFLAGTRVRRLAELKNEMNARAAELEFEAAGQMKEQLDQLAHLQRKARKTYHFPDKGDVLVLIRPFRERAFSAFFVRDRVVWCRADFPDGPDAGLFSDFMAGWDSPEATVDEWVAGCLTEISADKVFLRLPAKVRVEGIWQEIEKYYES